MQVVTAPGTGPSPAVLEVLYRWIGDSARNAGAGGQTVRGEPPRR